MVHGLILTHTSSWSPAFQHGSASNVGQSSPVVLVTKVEVFRRSSMLPHSCSSSVVPWVRMTAVVFGNFSLLCYSCSCSTSGAPWVRMTAMVFGNFSLLCYSCSFSVAPWVRMKPVVFGNFSLLCYSCFCNTSVAPWVRMTAVVFGNI